jgi:hypothetical protein
MRLRAWRVPPRGAGGRGCGLGKYPPAEEKDASRPAATPCRHTATATLCYLGLVSRVHQERFAPGLESPHTRLTQPRASTEADRGIARSGVRVLGRDEVYGA